MTRIKTFAGTYFRTLLAAPFAALIGIVLVYARPGGSVTLIEAGVVALMIALLLYSSVRTDIVVSIAQTQRDIDAEAARNFTQLDEPQLDGAGVLLDIRTERFECPCCGMNHQRPLADGEHCDWCDRPSWHARKPLPLCAACATGRGEHHHVIDG